MLGWCLGFYGGFDCVVIGVLTFVWIGWAWFRIVFLFALWCVSCRYEIGLVIIGIGLSEFELFWLLGLFASKCFWVRGRMVFVFSRGCFGLGLLSFILFGFSCFGFD